MMLREGERMKVGYIRVSSRDQNAARQEVLMRELGVECVYVEKISGKNLDRPQLKRMLSELSEGDTVVVSEFSRLARNTKDLLELVDTFEHMGVKFESQKERIDTSTPAGQFMLTVFAAVAQLERDYILARQREGIEAARAEGRPIGRPRVQVDQDQWDNTYKLWKSGSISAKQAMNELHMTRNTFYRRARECSCNSAHNMV